MDLERVDSIHKIYIPTNKKAMQFFIGKINFLRHFVPNFVEIIMPITNMIKKDAEIKWTLEARLSFQRINQALIGAPILVSPNYSKDFLFFSFSSKKTIDVVLLQMNEYGHEQTISFFSKELRDVELKYDIL
jgi:hypothetical protein